MRIIIAMAALGIALLGPQAAPAQEKNEGEPTRRQFIPYLSHLPMFNFPRPAIKAYVDDDGELHVLRSGRELEEDQIERRGSTVTVFDADGDHEVASFELTNRGDIIVPRGSQISIKSANRVQLSTRRKLIGIMMGDLTEAVQHQLGIKGEEGVLVADALDGYPASDAGMQKYDVIISFDRHRPVTRRLIRNALAERRPGDVIPVVVLRGGKEISLRVEAPEPSANFAPPSTWMSLPDAEGNTLRLAPNLNLPHLKLRRETEPTRTSERVEPGKDGHFEDLQQRLDRLERLVRELIENNRGSRPR